MNLQQFSNVSLERNEHIYLVQRKILYSSVHSPAGKLALPPTFTVLAYVCWLAGFVVVVMTS